MSKVGLEEAARLSGVSRATINRWAQKNKISLDISDAGGRLYDVSEILRYADASGKRAGSRASSRRDSRPVSFGIETQRIADLEARIGDLKARINALDADKQDIMHDRDHWRAQAEQATRLLTDLRPAAQPDARRGWWWRLFGNKSIAPGGLR
jgi:DNA-binding transcriptional MerR regulator